MTASGKRPGSAPQEWWSIIEGDERRQVVYDCLLRSYPVTELGEEHLGYLKQAVSDLVQEDWFEGLSTEAVTELSAIEGWDWERFIGYEGEPATTQHDLVAHELEVSLDFFLHDVDELLFNDLFEGTEHVAANLRYLRLLAGTYGFDLREVHDQILVESRKR